MADNEWTTLRYDYYTAGRTLWFSSQMQPGALMFGYAIEAHLKHLLSQRNSISQKLLHSHDLPLLFKACHDEGFVANVKTTDDLLEYALDNFHRRYPSQTRESSQRAKMKGRCLSQDIGIVLAYDDLILQLDTSITSLTKNLSNSLLTRAAHGWQCMEGRFFLHCNHAAVIYLDRLLKSFQNVSSSSPLRDRDIHWDKCVDLNLKLQNGDLLQAENVGIGVMLDEKQKADEFAESFTYPGKYFELPDGSITGYSHFG
jgi:hypothetical protein